ncbi:MAG: hypothetical protein JW938_01665 [Candidatus Omnitrophica bacterium]|nr:hypothetical protein [Candidatus Omnitrophota bacterium]
MKNKKDYSPPQIIEYNQGHPADAYACGLGSTASGTCSIGNSIAYPGYCTIGYSFGNCTSGGSPNNCTAGDSPQVWPAI